MASTGGVSTTDAGATGSAGRDAGASRGGGISASSGSEGEDEPNVTKPLSAPGASLAGGGAPWIGRVSDGVGRPTIGAGIAGLESDGSGESTGGAAIPSSSPRADFGVRGFALAN